MEISPGSQAALDAIYQAALAQLSELRIAEQNLLAMAKTFSENALEPMIQRFLASRLTQTRVAVP